MVCETLVHSPETQSSFSLKSHVRSQTAYQQPPAAPPKTLNRAGLGDATAFDPSTPEVEEGGSLCLLSELQVS